MLFVGSVGRVYKMDLTGKILGAFGRQGRMPGTLDSIHSLACPDEKTRVPRTNLCTRAVWTNGWRNIAADCSLLIAKCAVPSTRAISDQHDIVDSSSGKTSIKSGVSPGSSPW